MKQSSKMDFLYFGINLIVTALIMIPLLFALVSSLRPNEIIFKYVSPYSWRTLVPTDITFEPYLNLFALRGFGQVFYNTFLISATTVVFGIIINSLAAFGFVYFHFRGKQFLFSLVLVTFMIPFEVIAIPLYSVVDSFGWIDTYLALIVPGLANGLIIFMFRQFFIELPTSLVEAARMDGASWLRIFFSIIMPLCKSVSISAGLLLFIFMWESFMWPLISTQSDKYKVLTIAIVDFQKEHSSNWNEMFAASMLAILVPTLLIFFFQRYFVQSITSSGTKE